MVKTHSDRVRARREKEPGRGIVPTKKEWAAFCFVLGNRCMRCGATGVQLTRDHVVPLSQGGRNDLINLQPLCNDCNNAKDMEQVDYRPESYRELIGTVRSFGGMISYRLKESCLTRHAAYLEQQAAKRPPEPEIPYHMLPEARPEKRRFREPWE